jgi:hypothetical protein
MQCRKNNRSDTACWPDLSTERQIADKPAVVKYFDNQFFLIEQGTIDTRLKPCKLPAAFQIDGLSVIISGEVKTAVQATGQPCCTNNFVITNIYR